MVFWTDVRNGSLPDTHLLFDILTTSTILSTSTKTYSSVPGIAFENNNSTFNDVNGCLAYANFSYDVVVLVVCVVCLVVGFVYSFFGYRLFKIVLFLTGFLFGSVLISLLCEKEQLLSTYGNVGVGIGAGVLFGLITTLVQYVGLFMTGFLTGLLVGVVVMTVWSSIAPSDTIWVTIGVLFGTGVVFALLTLKFQRRMIIGSTSLIGGALIAVSFDYFVEKFLTVYRFWDALNVRHTYWNDICWYSWLIVAVWPLLFIIGTIVQLKLTSTGFDHKTGWPYFRRRRLRGGRGVNNNQRTNPSGSVRDHLRRGDMAPVPSSSSARCSSPKQPEGKSFRYLYQARRTHGDVICQSYIDNMQKLAKTQVSLKTTPTLTSDQTQLTILTNESNKSDPSNGSL